jgi:hypothetical protein
MKDDGSMRQLIVVALLTITGCASVAQSLSPEVFYRRDIELTVNGSKFHGTAVVPQSKHYEIVARPPGDADMFVFTTCHREETGEKLGGKVKWGYTPVSGLEDIGGCPAMIGSYDKDGKHSWAYIDFYTPEAQLPAKLTCNGAATQANGVSLCQAKVGLTQEIIFQEPVRVHPDMGCEIGEATDGKTFTFPIRSGICVYAFMGDSGKVHRLTTLGYSKILIRK